MRDKVSDSFLNHIVVVVEFAPLKDVLLANNVRVDEQVAVTHTEVLLAGSALEAFQVIDFVPHAHRHLERSDSLLTGCAEAVLAEQPEREKIQTLVRETKRDRRWTTHVETINSTEETGS